MKPTYSASAACTAAAKAPHGPIGELPTADAAPASKKLKLKAALEARGLKAFLSDISPGGNLQHVIANALSNCKLAIILATQTYGRKTNALFCTSAEMNFIVGNDRKPYYLVRMIPFGESWAEPATTMAFPPSIMFKLWLPGEPMPDDLVDEVATRLSVDRNLQRLESSLKV